MSLDVPPIGPVSFSAAPDMAPRGARVPADAATLSSDAVPEQPPPAVLDAIDGAARRYHELQAQGREMSFSIDEHGGVIVEVLALDGDVLCTIPSSKLLDVATGGSID